MCYRTDDVLPDCGQFCALTSGHFNSRLDSKLGPTELKMAGVRRIPSPRLPKPPAPSPSGPIAQRLASGLKTFPQLGGCRALWGLFVEYPDDQCEPLSSPFLVRFTFPQANTSRVSALSFTSRALRNSPGPLQTGCTQLRLRNSCAKGLAIPRRDQARANNPVA